MKKVSSKNFFDPTVSIIIPVYNAETTIEVLLDSLQKIVYDKKNIEVIVVDGGSTDKTIDIVKRYTVKLIVEPRKGLNIARNIGIRKSQGDIILFTDSDCKVPKDWVNIMVNNFKNPEIGCVGGSVVGYKNSFLSKYADLSFMPVLRRFRNYVVLDNVEPPLHYPAGCNMGFRRNIVERLGGFNESIHFGFDEDELVERICDSGFKMVLDPKSIIKHQHRTSLRRLLKQTFNYGRGGALMVKKKTKTRIAKWNLSTLLIFIFWILVIPTVCFFSKEIKNALLISIFITSIIPFAMLSTFYIYIAFKERNSMVFIYPFIDVLRLVAYCGGLLYGLK